MVQSPCLFQRAQTLLQRNGHTGGRAVRNKYGALLRGLLRCGPCGRAMSHTYTAKGNRRYHYYVCGTAQQRGWSQCPCPSAPAAEIERFVIEQIKCIGRDPAVLAETLQQMRRRTEAGAEQLSDEQTALKQQLRDDYARLQAAAAMTNQLDRVSGLADVMDRIQIAERRLTEVGKELAACKERLPDESAVAQVMAEFDQLWESLAPREQARMLALLVARVEYDGRRGKVSVTFQPTGLQAFAQEIARRQEQGK